MPIFKTCTTCKETFIAESPFIKLCPICNAKSQTTPAERAQRKTRITPDRLMLDVRQADAAGKSYGRWRYEETERRRKSVVDEGKGRSLVKAKGSPYKLGFLVAQGADGIFKSLNDAEAVDAMERAIVGTIRIMAMRRKAEFEKGTDAFDMSGGFNAVRDESALKEILKSIFGKQ